MRMQSQPLLGAGTDPAAKIAVIFGTRPEAIFVTGNPVIDALFLTLKKVRSCRPEIPGLAAALLTGNPGTPLVLITGHRRENFGAGFEAICQAVAQLASRFPQARFVYPVHLNPNVHEPVMRILGAGSVSRNVHLLEPLAYLPFVALLDQATLILTDSGGVQEEAPSLGKPVLVRRNTTERREAVEAGTVKLVGTDTRTIVEEASRLLRDRQACALMQWAHNPYGDGHSAARIATICREFLRKIPCPQPA